MIKLLIITSKDVGLEINREKSNILIFNEKHKPKEIEQIRVTSEIKYLGLIINDTVNCFKHYKTTKLEATLKYANMTYSIIARSCNKILIGKTYWKAVVLPCLLYGVGVVTWSKAELEKLQKIENSVWRCLLGAPGYTPIAAMRGDVGASCMNIRDVKTKLKYVKYAMQSSNEMLRVVMGEMLLDAKDEYVRKIKEYLNLLEIENVEELVNLTNRQIEMKSRGRDEMAWKEELSAKSTLEIYSRHKKEIKEETFYDNTEKSVLLFKARSNTLKLGWRNKYEGGNIICKLCGDGEETMLHFLKMCKTLKDVRVKHDMVGRKVEEILLFVDGLTAEQSKNYILEAWRRRCGIIKRLEANINS